MLTIRQNDMNYNTALYLISNNRDISGMCRVEFDDGDEELMVRPVILMLPYWEIYRKMGKPVKKSHIFFTGPVYQEKTYNKIMTRIYDECFDSVQDNEYFDRLKTAMWEAINYIDDFGTHELLEYVCGTSIIDLANIREDPEVARIVDIDMREELGPMAIKKNWLEGQEKLNEYLSREDTDNPLLPFISVGALKKSQIFQTLGHYGLRTEINDKIFTRPVYGNGVNGLLDFPDMVLENSASRKNVYYSKDAIRLVQYFSREMNLLCGTIAKIYDGYCGNDVTLGVFIDPDYHKRFVGKYFYLPEDPEHKLRVLTYENIGDYVGKWIDMYSILTCGHTDGVCERCMGLISRNYTRGINVGKTASSNAISNAAQLILSIKHDDNAIPLVYTIPAGASDWFVIGESGIRFKPSVSKLLPKLELGIFYKDISCSKGDLSFIAKDPNVPESQYSDIKTLVIKNVETNEYEEYIMTNDSLTPFLTTEFLLYVRDHIGNGIHEEPDLFWVPLKDMVRKTIPVMRSIIINDSMMNYVTHLTNMFRKSYLSKYTSASEALMHFAKTIFRKVDDVNIYQLEILLRGHMVTSDTDYSIPVVKDPENVRFDKTKIVLDNRTISGQLAHEGHNAHFMNPLTFVTLKDQHIFDGFLLKQ